MLYGPPYPTLTRDVQPNRNPDRGGRLIAQGCDVSWTATSALIALSMKSPAMNTSQRSKIANKPALGEWTEEAAEQSLQAAIAIALSQKARSFELRAALSLAKLYRAAHRDADAHAVLAPAVEGFPPTRQFPELTEAQTLLSALSS